MNPQEQLQILLINFKRYELDSITAQPREDRRFHISAVKDETELWDSIRRPTGRPDLLVIAAHGLHDADADRLRQQALALCPGLDCAVLGLSRALEATPGSARMEALTHLLSALTAARLEHFSGQLQCGLGTEELGQMLIQAAREVAEVEEAALLLPDPTGHLRRLTRPFSPDEAVTRLFRDPHFAHQRIRTGEPLFIDDIDGDERIHPAFLTTGIHALVALPIPGPAGPHGLLYAFQNDRYGQFNPLQLNALRTLAAHAGQALTAAAARETAEQNNRLMAGLIETGQALTRTKDIAEQLSLTTEFALRQLGVNTFFIGLFDPHTRLLRFPICIDQGQPLEQAQRLLDENDPTTWKISGLVILEQLKVTWADAEERRRKCVELGQEPMRIGAGSVTALYYPLGTKQNPAGVISFQSYAPHAFSPEMQTVYQALASQLSVAMENARLFKAEEERRREAETLHMAALTLSQDLNLEKLSEKLLDELARVIPYDTASVQVLEEGDFQIVAGLGFDNLAELKQQSFPVDEFNPNRLVWLKADAVILPDAPQQFPYLNEPPYRSARIHSWLGVPMLHAGQVIGMFSLDRHEPNFYTLEHARLAKAFASQAALALHNARLLKISSEGRDYLKSIYNATAAMIAYTDPDQVMQAIVDRICEATGARRAAALRTEEDNAFTVQAQSGFENMEDPIVNIRSNGISIQVKEKGAPWFRSNIDEDDPDVNPNMLARGVRAAACLPLRSAGQITGVLWIHYDTPHSFSETEQAALDVYANTSSLAHEHARLFKKSRDMEDEFMDVAHKSKEGILKDRLDSIVQAARRVLHADIVTLYTYNSETDEFDFPPATVGVSNITPVEAMGKVTRRSVVRRVFEIGKLYEAVDAQQKSLLTHGNERQADVEPFVLRENVRSMMAVPLITGGRTIGVLFSNYHQRHEFTEEDRDRLQTFADHAALTVDAYKSYEKASRRERQIQAVHDASKAINSTLALDSILFRIAQQARSLTGTSGERANFAHISLVDGDNLVCKAIDPPAIEHKVRPAVRLVHLGGKNPIGITGRAVRDGQSILLVDATTHPDYIEFLPGMHAELVVPIKYNDRVYGVINVEHAIPGTFDGQDQLMLEALADLAATAIRNAQLYNQSLADQNYIENLFRASGSVLSSTDANMVQQSIVEKIVKVTGAWRAVALLVDAGQEQPHHYWQYNFDDPWEVHIPIRPNGVSRTVIKTGQPFFRDEVLLDDPAVHPQTINSQVKAVACLPLHTKENRTMGVLWIHFHEPHHFEEIEKQALQIYADQSAMAYEFASHFEDMNKISAQLHGTMTLASVGFFNTQWRHKLEGHVITIRDEVGNIRRALEPGRSNPVRVATGLDKIERLSNMILALRSKAPVSNEDEVVSADVSELIEDRIKQISADERFTRVRMGFHNLLEKELKVRSSPFWLLQALEILVENARKATAKKSPPRIEVTVRAHPSDRRWLEIEVCDNGSGIPVEIKEDLMKKQIEKKPGEKGMGLGLLLARGIIEAYKGEIKLADTGENGTTFVICLPVDLSDPEKGE